MTTVIKTFWERGSRGGLMLVTRLVIKRAKQKEKHLTFLKPSYEISTSILNTVQDVRNKEKNCP